MPRKPRARGCSRPTVEPWWPASSAKHLPPPTLPPTPPTPPPPPPPRTHCISSRCSSSCVPLIPTVGAGQAKWHSPAATQKAGNQMSRFVHCYGKSCTWLSLSLSYMYFHPHIYTHRISFTRMYAHALPHARTHQNSVHAQATAHHYYFSSRYHR